MDIVISIINISYLIHKFGLSMSIEYTYIFYYLGVFILTLFLYDLFLDYVILLRNFNLVKAQSIRASHKGKVFTGGGYFN